MTSHVPDEDAPDAALEALKDALIFVGVPGSPQCSISEDGRYLNVRMPCIHALMLKAGLDPLLAEAAASVPAAPQSQFLRSDTPEAFKSLLVEAGFPSLALPTGAVPPECVLTRSKVPGWNQFAVCAIPREAFQAVMQRYPKPEPLAEAVRQRAEAKLSASPHPSAAAVRALRDAAGLTL